MIKPAVASLHLWPAERYTMHGEVLSLMEANDNHSEEHTVGEFIEWCVGFWD